MRISDWSSDVCSSDLDTDTRAEAREALESKLGADDPIAWVPLGLAFGISLDLSAVERALTRADTLNPQGDVEMALARLALANGQATAANAADYLQKHMRVMLAHLNRSEEHTSELQSLMRNSYA